MYKAYVGAKRPVGWGSMAHASYEWVIAQTPEKARELLIEALKVDPTKVVSDRTAEDLQLSSGRKPKELEGMQWLDYGEYSFDSTGWPMVSGGVKKVIEVWEELKKLNHTEVKPHTADLRLAFVAAKLAGHKLGKPGDTSVPWTYNFRSNEQAAELAVQVVEHWLGTEA